MLFQEGGEAGFTCSELGSCPPCPASLQAGMEGTSLSGALDPHEPVSLTSHQVVTSQICRCHLSGVFSQLVAFSVTPDVFGTSHSLVTFSAQQQRPF